MDLREKHYKIPIEGRWFLEDLYVFPRAYEQVYFLVYSLLPHEDENIQERIQYAYSQFPWQGGYSAVNFYNNLKLTTPKKQRPQVISLQYASPGWIELSLIIGVALSIEKLVKTVAKSLREANSVYHEIYEGTQKRKLLRIKVKSKELELEKAHADYIMQSVGKMADLLNMTEVDQITAKTGSPLKSLKILLSLYRRVRTLAEYQKSGKMKL